MASRPCATSSAKSTPTASLTRSRSKALLVSPNHTHRTTPPDLAPVLLGAETAIDDRATLLRDICTRIDAFTINLVALAEPKVPLAYAPDVSAMDAEFRKIDTVVVAYDSCLSLEAFEALWEDCAAVTRKMIADMTSASAKVESAAILEFIEGGVAVATTARTRLEPLQLEMKT